MDWNELLGEIETDTRWGKIRRLRHRLAPKELRRKVRWGIQRWRRGYSDCDVWNFDHYLAGVIPPAMRQLSRELHGVPGTIAMQFDATTHAERMDLATAEWRRILEAVAVGFEAWAALDEEHATGERREELTRRWETGSALLIEHFGGFWD